MTPTISWLSLSFAFIPMLIVAVIFYQWQNSVKELVLACARMVTQLIAAGYLLIVLFGNPSPWISGALVLFMLAIAAWIAIRPVRGTSGFFKPAVIALAISIPLHLAISLNLVMSVDNWYEPRILIPLAGMYLANTMNTLSLAAERFLLELKQVAPQEARINAFKAAMIPQVNGLLAVGVVALPGMMTGQILSGVSPLIAVRYQILIMTMIFGSAGIGCAIYLSLLARRYQKRIN